jgi:hypothetical protein
MKLFYIICFLPFLSFPSKKVVINDTNSYVKTIIDTMPKLPDAANVANGWVGQYVYTVKLNGRGTQPKPYSYYVNFDRIHTGYVELVTQRKLAIRANSPDRYNEQRWESWIAKGSKKSWNYVNDSVHQVTVITSDRCCLTPHDNFRTIKAGSLSKLKQGVTHGYDLQIDYSNGTYVLSMPIARCDAQQVDIWRVNKEAKSKNNYLRNVNDTTIEEFKTYTYFNEMDTIMGTFTRGQKEIAIRRTSSITYKEFLYHDAQGKPIYITPFAKGTTEFVLTLRKVGE